METSIDNLLQDYKNRTEENLLMQVMQLNADLVSALQKQKANSKLRKLTAFKIAVAVLGMVWIAFLAAIVRGTYFINPYFTVSVTMIIMVNIIAVAVYIKHIVLIQQINLSESIVYAQKKLAELQLSTITITRILFLQMPLWVTCWWNSSWINFGELKFWLIPFPIALAFTLAAIWLFKNISVENSNKKWFKLLFGTPEWTYVVQSMEFIKVIDDFKNEEV